jgi:hypothetical protein
MSHWLNPLPTPELQERIRELAICSPTVAYPPIATEICGIWVHDPHVPGYVACLQIHNLALDIPDLDPTHMFLLTGAQIHDTLRAFLGDLRQRPHGPALIADLRDACEREVCGDRSGGRGVGGIGFGVWHTHPSGTVGPSVGDLATARGLAKSFGRRIPQLVVSGPFGTTDGGKFAPGPAVQF